MHDRLGNYVVMTLEQVGIVHLSVYETNVNFAMTQLLPMSFGPNSLPTPAQLDALEKST
jgi:hypothetical protein